MNADRILALDVGTQSVRAMVFDATGALLARSRVPIEPYVEGGPPGCCEQDADLYWRAIGQACAGLWAMPEGRRDALAGVALTTQRGTVVVTDEAGDPLRRAMVWLDRCRVEGLPRIGGKWGIAFRAAGVTETVATFMAEAEANVLARTEPQTWAQVRHFLLLSGYLTHRLTGEFVDSVAAQVGYLPFDYRGLRWAAPGDWKWQAVPVRPEWLPRLLPPGDLLGVISQAAAAATGIPAGLPLIAAAGDKACEVLGSGALEPGIGAISLGTTATINTTHRRYYEVIPAVPPYPAAIPDTYSLEVNVYRGFWMIEWFKREFGGAEVARAELEGVEPEVLFDELIAATPPGSMGLILQPYWSPGVRIPGPEAKGAVIGWGDVHTRAHLYRAILEGLAYALREGAERTVQAHQGADPRASRFRRRVAEPRCRPADRRRLRPAHLAATHPRDVRTGRGNRRRRRPGPASVVRGRGRRDDPDRGDARASPRDPRDVRAALSRRLSQALRAPQTPLRRDPPDHRLSARRVTARSSSPRSGELTEGAIRTMIPASPDCHAATWSSPNTRNDRRSGPN